MHTLCLVATVALICSTGCSEEGADTGGSGDITDGGSGDGGSDGGSADGGSADGGSSDGGGSDGGSSNADDDDDGYPASVDCNDDDPAIHPDATEICDDKDNDCDGDIDDEDDDVTDRDTWYTDADGDGFGADDSTVSACDQPDGTASVGGDCDDADADRTPESGCFDGTYEGDIETSVTIAALGATDVCTGTVAITVEADAADPIDGTGDCTFAGDLASLLGTLEIAITGEYDSDGAATGFVTIVSYFTVDWEGSVESIGTIAGVADGTTTYEGLAVTYELAFEASK